MDINIYIEKLQDGEKEEFAWQIPSLLVLEEEEELHFGSMLAVRGEAYVAGDHLIIHFSIEGEAFLPCVVCNEGVKVLVGVNDCYHAEPLESISSGVFPMGPLIKENFLLEMPSRAECGQGACPERKNMQKYLRQEGPKPSHVQFPFAQLDRE